MRSDRYDHEGCGESGKDRKGMCDEKSILKKGDIFRLGAAMGFMFCIFAPLDTYFANKEEFWFSLAQVLPVLTVAFLIFTAAFFVFLFLIRRSKAAPYIYGFFICLYLFFYIQGNFVPRDYGVLNGTEIDWSGYRAYGMISIALMIICILFWAVSLLKFRDKVYAVGKYLCTFILLIQTVTLGTVWIRDAVTGEDSGQAEVIVTNKDLLNLSDGRNIIVLLLDTFDSQDMLDLLESEKGEEYRELFSEGFTYYPDTLGAYPTTKAALPHILTGVWYYNDKPYEEYVRDAYEDTLIYKNLQDQHFSVGVYTSPRYIDKESGIYTNVERGVYYINDYGRLAAKIYRLVAFNYMPHQLKRFFFLDTDEFEQLKGTSSEYGAYSDDMQTIYAHLMEDGLSVTEEGNCFRFYHMAGIHPPYTFGKDLVTREGEVYEAYDEAEGNCTFLKAFFEEMKEKGIYDNSTIIIMADHGYREYSQNPLFMIKNAGETDGFVISEEKMSFAYLSDIFVSLANGEKITEEYIHSCGKDQERHYLFYTWDNLWDRDYLPTMQEICSDGYAGDADSLRMTGREYELQDAYIHYLNDVLCRYTVGNIIDTIYFYTDQYNADLYVQKGLSGKEEWGSWTEGDELRLSFPLKDTDAPFISVDFGVYSTFYQPQSVTILINGKQVYQNTIEGDQEIKFVFENPGTETVELTMLLPDAVAPCEVVASEDSRKLGVGLLTMQVAEAEYEISRIPDDGIVRFDEKGYNANAYVISGIEPPEKEGAWTKGDKVLLHMNLDSTTAADTVQITLDLQDTVNRHQDVAIEINGEEVYVGTVSKKDKTVSFEIPFPQEGYVLMAICSQNAASTMETGQSEESEKLGLMLKDIQFTVK